MTYRIYDYDRRDAAGNPRQLHVEESVDAIDFNDTEATEARNVKVSGNGTAEVAKCSYFVTDLLGVDEHRELSLAGRDSFTILVSVDGNLTLTGADGQKVAMPQGTTVLVPACLPSVEIEGNGQVISVYIP